jgi:hypothetical protein
MLSIYQALLAVYRAILLLFFVNFTVRDSMVILLLNMAVVMQRKLTPARISHDSYHGISDVAPSNFSKRKLLDKGSKLNFMCDLN